MEDALSRDDIFEDDAPIGRGVECRRRDLAEEGEILRRSSETTFVLCASAYIKDLKLFLRRKRSTFIRCLQDVH